MRPRYETASDLTKERQAVERFLDSFPVDAEAVKLPMQYRMDFCIVSGGNASAFVEVKCRTNKMHAYPTYMISLSKMVAAAAYSRLGITCILLVQWSDKSGWVKIDPDGWSIKWGGRRDRADWQDSEPVVHIPISDFTEQRADALA